MSAGVEPQTDGAEGGDGMLSGRHDLLRYTRATALVGGILKIQASNVGLGDIAMIEMPHGEPSLAQGISCGGMKCRSRSSAVAQGFLCRCGCASSGTRRRVHHRGTVLSAQPLIGPCGSLSPLKQNVIGTMTRQDHAQLMKNRIRLYAGG